MTSHARPADRRLRGLGTRGPPGVTPAPAAGFAQRPHALRPVTVSADSAFFRFSFYLAPLVTVFALNSE